MSHRLSEVCARVSPGAGSHPNRSPLAAAAAALSVWSACGVLVAPVRADIDPLSGIDFVTIGVPGNAPYRTDFPDGFPSTGGSVSYEYRIGRMEVTTGHWVEFFNAAFDRPDPLPHLIPPTFWGAAATTPNTPGGQRWAVPAGNENMPVGNVSWRMAAMYCNWLHNGKSADRSAFLNGAYDVSTFGFFGNIFTDQAAHNPNARYWIPTWDEWIKAAHYDPNANGGTGGWWNISNGSDSPYVYGPPGVGHANAGWDVGDFPGQSPFAVPLGAYPGVTSPWGLLDAAGGTIEWTETIQTTNTGVRARVVDGSFWGQDAFQAGLDDRLRPGGAEFPHLSSFEFGLRVAAVVPAASTCAPVGVLLVLLSARRRRPATCENGSSA